MCKYTPKELYNDFREMVTTTDMGYDYPFCTNAKILIALIEAMGNIECHYTFDFFLKAIREIPHDYYRD